MMPEPMQLGLDGRETASTAPPVPDSSDAPRVGLFDGAAFTGIRGQLALETEDESGPRQDSERSLWESADTWPLETDTGDLTRCPYGCDRGRLAQWGDPARAITCPGCQI